MKALATKECMTSDKSKGTIPLKGLLQRCHKRHLPRTTRLQVPKLMVGFRACLKKGLAASTSKATPTCGNAGASFGFPSKQPPRHPQNETHLGVKIGNKDKHLRSAGGLVLTLTHTETKRSQRLEPQPPTRKARPPSGRLGERFAMRPRAANPIGGRPIPPSARAVRCR